MPTYYRSSDKADETTAAVQTAYAKLTEQECAELDDLGATIIAKLDDKRGKSAGLGALGVTELMGKLGMWLAEHPEVRR